MPFQVENFLVEVRSFVFRTAMMPFQVRDFLVEARSFVFRTAMMPFQVRDFLVEARSLRFSARLFLSKTASEALPQGCTLKMA
ncbi:hypothetical protein [Myxacorys almedinensis]|uniref:Uncharacterized protein n=1 Tax=Myxacorys almedinensis A TaxID=2690445 RepID=A0A8J7YXT6_9CYAN|nr:hypothetical protein [Myxacorys almedinensis]NDJ16647.1 hypothetical protein [Myxacorys almedinensis A]